MRTEPWACARAVFCTIRWGFVLASGNLWFFKQNIIEGSLSRRVNLGFNEGLFL